MGGEIQTFRKEGGSICELKNHFNYNNRKYDRMDEAKANGLLIATAPEMIEALIEADFNICMACKRLNPHHENCNHCDDRDERIKIIEKATGLKIDEIIGG